jgi:hypothetical protein
MLVNWHRRINTFSLSASPFCYRLLPPTKETNGCVLKTGELCQSSVLVTRKLIVRCPYSLLLVLVSPVWVTHSIASLSYVNALDASTGTFSAAHFRCLNSTSTSALTQLQALTQITLHQRLHISPKSRAVDTPRKALSHRHHGLQSTNARSRAANASRAR